MSRRWIGTVLFLALSAPALLPGQETQPETTSRNPQHLGAEAPPLTMQVDPEYKNVIIGGVFLGGTWDSRGLVRSANPLTYGSDTRGFVQPSIAFQETNRNLSWTVAYTPGFSVSQHRTSNNEQYTQNLAGDLQWTPTTRLNLHLRQDYSISDNPFERVGRVPILPELDGYFGPNDGTLLLDQKRTTLVSNAELSYRLTRHTALGVTGGYQRYDYGNLSPYYAVYSGLTLPSHTYTGSLYYSWQFSKTQTLGLQYAFSDFYTEPFSRVQAHSALLFDTWKITPHISLTIYGGPQLSHSKTTQIVLTTPPVVQPVSRDSVGSSGGMTLNWSGQRSGLQLTGVRRVSDGGGLMSAVTMTSVQAALRRQLSRRLSGDARVSLMDQRAMQLFASQGRTRTVWAGGGLMQQISDGLSVRVEYGRVRQTGAGTAATSRMGNHNLVQFALNWQFRKALGR